MDNLLFVEGKLKAILIFCLKLNIIFYNLDIYILFNIKLNEKWLLTLFKNIKI